MRTLSPVRMQIRFKGPAAGRNAGMPVHSDIMALIVKEFVAEEITLRREELLVTVALPAEDVTDLRGMTARVNRVEAELQKLWMDRNQETPK